MKDSQVVEYIFELSGNSMLSFAEDALSLQGAVTSCTTDEILEHLDNAGVIPECFRHDSSEEKLFAKYCDALLVASWKELGIDAKVIPDRSDAADVTGSYDDYIIVGDAKAFRLSRTAKNQKDFKIEALNQWRKGANYASLLAPLYQYPKKKSQIYGQAIRFNVTLLSYLTFRLKGSRI